jgi:ribosomal-protein-alanine N-acetyltransferase
MKPEELYAQFPRLESKNLVLRDLVPKDAGALFHIFSDPEVTRYYDLETFQTMAEARELIEHFNNRFLKRFGIRWGIARKETPDTLIGTCGYNIWIHSSCRAIVGYDLGRAHWGQGIMSEALERVLAFGFGTMELNRIEAAVFPDNIPSHRLLKKLGFQREGVLREYEFLKGEFVDLTMYSLLRREAVIDR